MASAPRGAPSLDTPLEKAIRCSRLLAPEPAYFLAKRSRPGARAPMKKPPLPDMKKPAATPPSSTINRSSSNSANPQLAQTKPSVFSTFLCRSARSMERFLNPARKPCGSRSRAMKAILVFILSAGIAAATHAQLVVTNPISDALAEVNHLEDVAKSIEMINNQVQQINALTQQLQQITVYVQAFGDPAKLLSIIGVDGLIQSLETSGVGHTLAELQELASGIEALRGNATGLYQSIGETNRTPSGFELPH